MLENPYEIMSGNTTVALYNNVTDQLTYIDRERAPLYLVNYSDFKSWLSSRAIDSSRPSSRLLKKALHLKKYDDVSTVLAAKALTITDNYWVREVGSSSRYEDIKFTSNPCKEFTLHSSLDSFDEIAMSNLASPYTPELTNIGSFDKCWQFRNQQWYLIKKANSFQQISEVFICLFGKHLNFNMAEYFIESSDTITTKDFTNAGTINFEPAYSFMLDNDDYLDNALKLLMFDNQNLLTEYFNIIFMDALVFNPDRHTFNYGILRDSKTGEIISLAPNFDNNMALLSLGIPRNIERNNNLLVNQLLQLINKYPKLKQLIPSIKKENLEEILVNMNLTEDLVNIITTFIMNGYCKILTSSTTNYF